MLRVVGSPVVMYCLTGQPLTAVKRAAPFGEVKQFDAATFEEKFRSIDREVQTGEIDAVIYLYLA